MISAGLKFTREHYISKAIFVNPKGWFAIMGFGLWLTMLSCKDSPSISTQGLNGRWEIYSADRNGRETPYLRGGYFVFDAQGNLIVNITGTEQRGTFEIKDNVITLNGDIEYTISSMRKDSMDIRYVMNPESEFMFFLTKTKNETH